MLLKFLEDPFEDESPSKVKGEGSTVMKYLASPSFDPLAKKFCSACAAGLDYYKMGLHNMEKFTYQFFMFCSLTEKTLPKSGCN